MKVAKSDNEPAKPAEVSDHGHRASALAMLEAAVAALRARAEAAEQRADAADVDRQAAQTRADHTAAERDGANRRAHELKMLLDAARLELAGLRTLIDVAPHAAIQAEADRQGWSATPRPERQGGGHRLVWVTRIFVATVAAVAQWFVTPFLHFGTLQALLSLVVFISVMLVLVLVSWRRAAGGESDEPIRP
jgi:hypothetical protein